MKSTYFLFVIIVSSYVLQAQPGIDSLMRDTSLQTAKKTDSLSQPAAGTIPLSGTDAYIRVLRQHPYFNFFSTPRNETVYKRTGRNKDGLFYLLTGLALYFVLVRLVFRKYMGNLFSVFFGVSLKQKQIREQLLISPLPSLLLNIFFVIAGGIYISFLFDYYQIDVAPNRWYLIFYCTAALVVIYIGKLLVLKLMGWIFNISGATDTYIFVVFMVNKILGIFLAPFLLLLTFSSPGIVSVFTFLSFAVIAILFAYRYIISYSPVRKEIKVSQFHFFVYICALEIIPLLLIYKVLVTYLLRST